MLHRHSTYRHETEIKMNQQKYYLKKIELVIIGDITKENLKLSIQRLYKKIKKRRHIIICRVFVKCIKKDHI